MSTTKELEQGRVSKREFVQRFARRGGLPVRVAQQAYDAMIEELLDLVNKGNRVTLTGFGKFYPQEHKGHRVILGGAEGFKSGDSAEVDDYTVLKFSATREVNRGLKTKAS